LEHYERVVQGSNASWDLIPQRAPQIPQCQAGYFLESSPRVFAHCAGGQSVRHWAGSVRLLQRSRLL